MYVPMKAKRGHQIPRNWSYMWMAMWGLAIEPRPLVRAARDLNCWAISAIIWVMFWFEFKIGLKAAERRHLVQDLLMNVQPGGGSRRQAMAGWGHSLQLTLQTNRESSCLTCWFLLLCLATTPISQLDCDNSQKQDRIGQLWPIGNDDHFGDVTRKSEERPKARLVMATVCWAAASLAHNGILNPLHLRTFQGIWCLLLILAGSNILVVLIETHTQNTQAHK